MKPFVWSTQYETGLETIDSQHLVLVEQINNIAILLSDAQDVHTEILAKTLPTLVEYTKFHFGEEETLMELAGVYPPFAEHHKAQHASFIAEIDLYNRSVHSGNMNYQRLLTYLIDWLAYHILGVDHALVKQIKLIESGVTPEQAYLSSMQSVTERHMVDPFLRALDGLFREVCRRNQELSELNKSLESKVSERTIALRNANERLEHMAFTDALTGISNRRHIMARLAKEFAVSVTNNAPLSCLLIDADGFKKINDTYGHDAGDIVIKQLAQRLVHSVRTDDLVGRLGGDEFFIILPNTDRRGASHIAEIIRNAVATLYVPVSGGGWKGSISIGVASRNATTNTHEDLVKLADQGVYLAKNNGRNCVAISEWP